MTTYTALIDNGQGGETTIEARTLASAQRKAEAWARAGQWSDASARNPEWDGRVELALAVKGKTVRDWSYKVTGHGGRRPGAGRPRIGPEVKIDLPAALIASYDALAERRGQTRAGRVRAGRACRAGSWRNSLPRMV